MEMLVSVAVMILLVALVAQLTNNATSVVTGSGKHMEADQEARVVFSRIAQDIEGMVQRSDADILFVKNPGNDAFYFYSQAAGYYPGGEGPKAPFSLVGYRIANRDTESEVAPNGVLERVGVGLGYDNTQIGKIMRFLTYPDVTQANPSPTPLPESTLAWTHGANGNPTGGNKLGTGPAWDNPDYIADNQSPVSSQVFRMEFCFLMDDGTYFVPPSPGSSRGPTPHTGQRSIVSRQRRSG